MEWKKIEKKWQKKWEEEGVFKVKKDGRRNKWYVLEMFPYSSSKGLHMGHAFNYTIGDIYARFKRMQGFNVLYPMGYDSFGLPAENAAIKAGTHPKEHTEKAIKNFIKQQKSLGLSYDWDRIIMTHRPEYYKWNQYFFLKFLEQGLVYKKKAPVNWCPECKTVLANEQVHNGKCWRHEDTEVEIKHLEQWFIKTTKYADQLLNGIDDLDWPERIKIMQKNWIGKSFGTEIKFEVDGKKWEVFTTRPDTIFGVTFMVVASNHPDLMDLVTEEQKEKVEQFLKSSKTTSEEELDKLEKEGVFTGKYAVNPITKEKVPIYVGNFVLAEYGSGMVMAVPAHDQRDFEFAKKYDLPIKVVIKPKDKDLKAEKMKQAYTEGGVLVNSGDFNDLDNREAIKKISDYIENNNLGKKAKQYKLKDWLISRQRYWGTPIPIVYCKECGMVPVPEKDLPVKLPKDVEFREGNPLETSDEFVNTKCPKCGNDAKRETDTMDTFFDSSWYFLRYCDNKNNKKPFDQNKVNYWMPVDQYIGGAEHATMHLIYARFFIKALRDLGMVDIDEPFIKLFNQGMLHGPDGYVMSKSRGNVILPETISKKYGIDTARFFLISVASPNKDIQWSGEGIEGSYKIINKIWSFLNKVGGKLNNKTEHKMNKTIKEVTSYINGFEYNKAIVSINKYVNYLHNMEKIPNQVLETLVLLISPIAPHISEEIWERLGHNNFVSLEKWPQYNENKINEKFEQQEEAQEQLLEDIRNVINIVEGKGENVQKVEVFAIPDEMDVYKEKKKDYENQLNVEININTIQNYKGGKKAKPGKPVIIAT